jgi:hypothetical protein
MPNLVENRYSVDYSSFAEWTNDGNTGTFSQFISSQFAIQEQRPNYLEKSLTGMQKGLSIEHQTIGYVTGNTIPLSISVSDAVKIELQRDGKSIYSYNNDFSIVGSNIILSIPAQDEFFDLWVTKYQ